MRPILLSYSVASATNSLNKKGHLHRVQWADVPWNAFKRTSLISCALLNRVIVPHFFFFTSQQHLLGMILFYILPPPTKRFRLLAGNTLYQCNHFILLKKFWVLLLGPVREHKARVSQLEGVRCSAPIHLPHEADPRLSDFRQPQPAFVIQILPVQELTLFTLPHWIIFSNGHLVTQINLSINGGNIFEGCGGLPNSSLGSLLKVA